MRRDLCLFAVEDWLSRFPGFVDNLALRLCAYASGYHQSFKNVLVDSDGPPEECDVLCDLLLQLRFMHNNNPELVEDYERFCERARLALSEIEAAWSQSSSPSSEGSPPPQDGLDPAAMSPRTPSTSLLVIPVASGTQAGSLLVSQVLSASSSVIDLRDGPAHRPRACIVRASNQSGKVSSSSLAAGVSAPPLLFSGFHPCPCRWAVFSTCVCPVICLVQFTGVQVAPCALAFLAGLCM